jgi:hypothetical protein
VIHIVFHATQDCLRYVGFIITTVPGVPVNLLF